jgi:hypothetical protein
MQGLGFMTLMTIPLGEGKVSVLRTAVSFGERLPWVDRMVEHKASHLIKHMYTKKVSLK